MKNKLLTLITIFFLSFFICSCNNSKKDELNNSSELSNTIWEFQGDKSQIHFSKDNTFKYYQSKDKLDDYYYTGDYEFYKGKAAVKFITEDLKDYGVTNSEIKSLLSRNKEYSEDNMICLVLNNKEQIIEKKNVLTETKITPYFGFYFNNDKEYFDIANMNSGNYSTLIKAK